VARDSSWRIILVDHENAECVQDSGINLLGNSVDITNNYWHFIHHSNSFIYSWKTHPKRDKQEKDDIGRNSGYYKLRYL